MFDRNIGEFSRFVVIALGAVILGVASGHWWLAVTLALAVYLTWVLWQQHRFNRWLSNGRRGPTPTSFGIWGDIADDFYRLQRRHRREKQRLHSTLRRVQDSTSALREGVVALEDDGNLAWWNPVAGQMLRLQTGDAGQPLINFVRDPGFVNYIQQPPQGGANDLCEPLTMPAPGDDARMLQLEITRYGLGEALVVVRDITRLHNLELMRQDFVANVSHELRTPLTVIAGYLETLESSGQAPQNWQRPLDQMREQAERMTSLVNDLLLLSRLETTERNGDHGQVSVRQLIEGVAAEARALSRGEHKIIIECDDGAKICGNPAELHSAFANLVSNAVRYSPAGGAINLQWDRNAQGGHFSVRDAGIGIDAIHIPRLTERFYRVDEGRSRQDGGTGLGLAIVKHVLLRHGGQLQIDSTPGQGSTFTLSFPMQQLAALA